MNFKDKEQHQIDQTVECVEALAKIVKDNDLGRIKISTEDLDIVIEGRRCPPPPVGVMPPMGRLLQPPRLWWSRRRLRKRRRGISSRPR